MSTQDLKEFWSDAARAAAVAARRAKAKLAPMVSSTAARAEAQGAAKRLMDKRREVMAAQKAAASSSHPLDQRLAKMHGEKLAAIDRVGAKLAPKIKNPRKEAIKSAGRSAGQFLKRLFFKECEQDAQVYRFVEALVCLSEGTDLREANYAVLMEKWSDAARAAALAARRAKAKGGDWRKAARDTYFQKTGEKLDAGTQRAIIKKMSPSGARREVWGAVANDPSGSGWQVRGAGRTPGEAQAAARKDAADKARGWKKMGGSVSRGIAQKFVGAGKAFTNTKGKQVRWEKQAAARLKKTGTPAPGMRVPRNDGPGDYNPGSAPRRPAKGDRTFGFPRNRGGRPREDWY